MLARVQQTPQSQERPTFFITRKQGKRQPFTLGSKAGFHLARNCLRLGATFQHGIIPGSQGFGGLYADGLLRYDKHPDSLRGVTVIAVQPIRKP